jgi:hypothetical protein
LAYAGRRKNRWNSNAWLLIDSDGCKKKKD